MKDIVGWSSSWGRRLNQKHDCSFLIRRKNTSLCVSSYTLFVWMHVHSSTTIRHWGMFPGLPLSINQPPNQNNINVRQSSSTRHFIRTCKLSNVTSVFRLLLLPLGLLLNMANRWYHVGELNLCVFKLIRFWYWYNYIMALWTFLLLYVLLKNNLRSDGLFYRSWKSQVEVDHQHIAQCSSPCSIENSAIASRSSV